MQKKELVTLLMESPLYFDLRVEERLALLQDHVRRFPPRSRQSGLLAPLPADPGDVAHQYPVPPADQSARLVVGYLAPAKLTAGT